jgi:hypothetical protein
MFFKDEKNGAKHIEIPNGTGTGNFKNPLVRWTCYCKAGAKEISRFSQTRLHICYDDDDYHDGKGLSQAQQGGQLLCL